MEKKKDALRIPKDIPEDFFKIVSGILNFIEDVDRSNHDKQSNLRGK